MNKSDNNEIDELLDNYSMKIGATMWMQEREILKLAIDEHYKKKYLALVPEKRPNYQIEIVHGTRLKVEDLESIGFNKATQLMTNNINQFNSKGDRDE